MISNTDIQITLDQEMVVKEFWTKLSEVNNIQDNRVRRNVIYKYAFFVSCRELSSLSLSSIGGIIGKNHATVLHAVRTHQANYMYDAKYREVYDQIHDSLNNQMTKFNDGIGEMIERRITKMDGDVYNRAVIDMYKKRLDNQNASYQLKIDTMKHEINVLRRSLKASRNRENSLNEECKRLKNLL